MEILLNVFTGHHRRKRNKEWKTILPKSEIRTRGAKLPNFSLHMKIRPSRKEQRAIENASLRSSIGYSEVLLTKSGAKKGRRELPPAFTLLDFPIPPPEIRQIKLSDNPEFWSASDTARFLAQTSDCAHLGMISHKKSLITIFGHNHEIVIFIKKFDIFHLKISTAVDFGLYLERNCEF